MLNIAAITPHIESPFARVARRRNERLNHQQSNIADLELLAKKCLIHIHHVLRRRENDLVTIRGYLDDKKQDYNQLSANHRAFARVFSIACTEKPEDLPISNLWWVADGASSTGMLLLEELQFLEEAGLIKLQLKDPTNRDIKTLNQIKCVNLTEEGKRQAIKLEPEIYPALRRT